MKKGSKIIIGICIFFCVVLGGLYIFLINQKTVEFPPSPLVYSIFSAESSLSTYKPSEMFRSQYTLKTVPYTIDVPKGDFAHVGNGIVFIKNQQGLVFSFVTEKEASASANDIILEEFPKAILYDYNEQSSIADVMIDEGFINGYPAKYFIKLLKITNGTTTIPVYIIGYELSIEGYSHSVLFFNSTGVNSTEALTEVAKMSYAQLFTLNYSESMAELLPPDIDNVTEGVSDNDAESSQDYIIPDTGEDSFDGLEYSEDIVEGEVDGTSDDEDGELEYDDDITPTMPDDAETTSMSVSIDSDYSDGVMTVSWDNTSTLIECRLYDSTGIVMYEADSYDTGYATIPLGEVLAGDYTLEITGKDYGDINYSVSER